MENEELKQEVVEFLLKIANAQNWCAFDESGCAKGVGFYRESWHHDDPIHPIDIAQSLLDKLL